MPATYASDKAPTLGRISTLRRPACRSIVGVHGQIRNPRTDEGSMNPVYGASTTSAATSRPEKSVLRCDYTTSTFATGARSRRYRSFAFHHRITGSADWYIRRSSWYALT
jgi:hypothetical protein